MAPEQDRLALRAQIVEGWLNFEPMERVTRWGEVLPMSVLSTGRTSVVTTRAWTVQTSRGGDYAGVSVLTGCPSALDQDMRDRMLRRVYRDGRPAGVHLLTVSPPQQ